MKKAWDDPVKRKPSEETMSTPGDFKVFTDLMKRVVEKKPKPASPAPAAS